MDYTKLEPTALVSKILTNKELCPVLLIGSAYTIAFKRGYTGNIISLHNLTDVRSMLEFISNSGSDDIIAIDGVGFLSATGQNSLLKFIEEAKSPIVLLSLSDKVSPIIMSRMKNVIKSHKEVRDIVNVSTESAFNYIKDKKEEAAKQDNEFSEYLEVDYYANNCPKAFALKMSTGDSFSVANMGLVQAISRLGG